MMKYDKQAAAAFRGTRHLTSNALDSWREPVRAALGPSTGMRLLDLGSGTGAWATAFTAWFAIEVDAVEPSAEMRAQSTFQPTIAGSAERLPLASDSIDAAWLSTVIHHFDDIGAAVAELRRVLRPGAPVLIRSVFPRRHEGITLFKYFPQATAALDYYPSAERVRRVFGNAGFRCLSLTSVPQVSAESLQAMADAMNQDAHTPLRLISRTDYETGLHRLREAAKSHAGPVVDYLDLMVLRLDGSEVGQGTDEPVDERHPGASS